MYFYQNLRYSRWPSIHCIFRVMNALQASYSYSQIPESQKDPKICEICICLVGAVAHGRNSSIYLYIANVVQMIAFGAQGSLDVQAGGSLLE